MDKRRTQFGRENTIVRKSSSGIRGRLLRSLDSVLDRAARASSSIRQWAAPETRERVALEPLDPRVLLSVTLAPNEFTLLDSGANANGVVAVDSATTAGVSVGVTTDGSTLSAIAINLPADSAIGAYTVNIFTSGVSGQTPTISFTNLDTGDRVTLNFIVENVSDNAGAGSFTPIGDTSGYTAATYVADAGYGAEDPTASDLASIGDGGTFNAAGNIGTTTIAGTLGGGAIAITNTVGNSNIGAVTIGGIDTTVAGGTAFSAYVQAGAAADNSVFGGYNVTGTTKLGANGATFTTDADNGAGTNSFGAINLTGAGSFLLTTAAGTNGGNTTTGLVTIESTGGLTITSANDQNLGSTTLGGVTFVVGATGDVTIAQGGTGNMGGVNTGTITNNAAAGANISIGNANSTISSVSIGANTNVGASTVTVVADTISGNVSFGAQNLQGSGGVSVGVTNSAGNINFGDVTLALGSSGSITVTADDLGNVTAASTWTFLGSGGIYVEALTGDIGTVGGSNLDVVFGAVTTGGFGVRAADGIGASTFGSVSHVNVANGFISLEANTDGGTEALLADQIGDLGLITVLNASAEANGVQWGNGSYANGLSIAGVSLAGGANGTFEALNPLFNAGGENEDIGGSGSIGPVAFGGTSDGVTLLADDGITSITVTGPGSRLINATVNANFDAAFENGLASAGNINGALGPVSVSGQTLLAVTSLSGDFSATQFGLVTLSNGSFNATFDTEVGSDANRAIKTDSSFAGLTVTAGRVTGGSLLIDDGIGPINVTHPTPLRADVTFATLNSDTDGTEAIADAATLAGATGANVYGGGMQDLIVQGALTITTLRTHETGDDTFRSSQSAGLIRAGQSIAIGTIEVGGNLPSIQIVNVAGTAVDPDGADPNPDIAIGTLNVNGDVDSISTNGNANEDITIGGGTIGGDLDSINAGSGLVTIGSLQIVTGVASSPIYVITSADTDYILAIDGQFTSSIDTTIAGVFHPFWTPTISINDIAGPTSSTSVLSTDLFIATRAAGTAHTAADNSPAPWDLTSLQDAGADVDGQHDFRKIVVEGSVLGDLGADSDPFNPNFTTASGFPENILGDIGEIQILYHFDNASGGGAARVFAKSLGEISYGTSNGPLSFDTPGGVSAGVSPPGGNTNGTYEDLEIFTVFAPVTEVAVISIPDGGSITKNFVGPTGELETITLTDTSADGVLSTVAISFSGGVIVSLHLYGQTIGIEYNALDPLNPATNSSTNIFYGVDLVVDGNTLAGTEPTAAGINAIEFLEFSSAIGDVSVIDIDTTNNIAASVGNSISVGYVVVVDGQSDISNNGGLSSYINDNNDGSGNGSQVPLDGAGNPIYAGLGNVFVQGSLGPIVSSGGVGSITTEDTTNDANNDGVPDAFFSGLVTDGSAGEITIDGHVTGSLVVGDRVILSTGADEALGGGDDVIGINGTPGFGGAINVAGSIGSSQGRVTTLGTDPNSPNNADGNPIVNGQRPSIQGDEISAPDGISVNITSGEVINAAIVSGKRAAVADSAGNFADAGGDITGSIQGSEIMGDIWSGGSIGTEDGGQQIVATGLGVVNANSALSGNIGDGTWPNRSLQITATGASPGNIYSDILAAGNMINIQVIAGSGSGGSILGNIVAGTDGSGGVLSTNNSQSLSSILLADNDIGINGQTVVSSADSQTWFLVSSGRQTDGVAFGGNVNSDFVAGIAIGASTPHTSNVNSATLPLMQNESDSITIQTLSAGTVDGVDEDGNTLNDMNSHLNGTLAAAGSIYVGNLVIDGNAIGNDGVAGGHIAAAGLGQKDSINNLDILEGTIVADLLGTFSAGLFVPADQSGNSPLNSNDRGPLQAGTVLTLGSVNIGDEGALQVGRWLQSATGSNDTPAANGINLNELLAATESGVVSGYVPAFSIGATNNIYANIDVVGRPYAAPQTGPGNDSLRADGDAVDVSIAAFGDVSGNIDVYDSADFNFVLANIDAVTSIDTSSGNPSAPGTNLPHNSEYGNLNLTISSYGWGDGGLDVEYFLAGFDYFTRLASSSTTTPGFWESFGKGSINGSLNAYDNDRTNGREVGDLRFALIAAGEDINGSFYADDDILARYGSASTDGSFLFRGGVDADIVAGASGNSSISPFGDGLFVGGNINGNIYAGDDIVKQATVIPGTPDQIIVTNTAGSSAPQTLTYGNAPSDVLTFNQFNPASISAPAGSVVTLTGVTITAISNVSAGTATITRPDTTQEADGSIAVTQGSTLTSSAFSGGSILISNNVSVPVTLVVGDNSETVTIPADSSGTQTITPGALGGFTGTGTFTVNVAKSQSATPTGSIGGGGINLNLTGGLFDGSVTITYTYNIQTTTVIPGTPDQVIGDQIVNIGAIGSEVAGTGNINGSIRSGLVQQLNGPDLFDNGDDEQGDIYAFIVAGDSVNGEIDAGNVNGRGSNAAGNFTGGVWAGAGVDLDIHTTNDNSFGGSIDTNIHVAGTLDVRNANNLVFGIYAEDSIDDIRVGYNINGGNILGNIVAEEDIDTIEVWGNLGAEGQTSLIFAGDEIEYLAVGNPIGADGSVAGHSTALNTSTFGTVYADVYIGGKNGNAETNIHIGQGFAPTATLVAGLEGGMDPYDVVIEQFGRVVTFGGDEGSTSMVLVLEGGNFGGSDADAPGYGPDVWLFNSNSEESGSIGSGDSVSLRVSGNGAAAGLGRLIAVDSLSELHVIDGSVEQIIVDDDFNIKGEIDSVLSSFGSLAAYPFATNSLRSVKAIEYAVNNSKDLVNAGVINVDYNIGTTGTSGSIGRGLTGTSQSSNVAIWVQGSIVGDGEVAGSVTSHTGSIGNIFTGGSVWGADFEAYVSVGDIYAMTGGFGSNVGTITAHTGSMGVLSVRDAIHLSESQVDVSENIGGLISRNSTLTVDAHVHGSIGLLLASGTINAYLVAETGSIGIDLDANDIHSPVHTDSTFTRATASSSTTAYGIFSDSGDVDAYLLAGGNIGNTGAYLGDIYSSYTAGGSIGHLSAGSDIDGYYVAQRGTIGNLLAKTGNIGSFSDYYYPSLFENDWNEDGYGPIVLIANGGVSINPDTLLYEPAPVNGRRGIGTIYAELGSINVDATTGGDIGTDPNANDNIVRGGIAAPLGEVNARLKVGGNVGGLSGQVVSMSEDSVVLGSIGLIRNLDASNSNESSYSPTIYTAQGVNQLNPLILITLDSNNNLVDYRVDIQDGGSALVEYSVSGGVVTFHSITYTPDSNPETTGGIAITTQNGNSGRTLNAFSGSYVDSNSTSVSVEELVVNGSVSNIIVEGDLPYLTVNGNLAGGTLSVESLGNAHISGNIGTSSSALQNIHVAEGKFESLVAGGTNFGLRTVQIDSNSKTSAPQVHTFTNTLNNKANTNADNVINAYIGSGSATLTINNGYIETILLDGKSASNLVVVSASSALSADALKEQANLVKNGALSKTVKGVTVLNEVLGSDLAANVGKIVTLNNGFSLKGAIVEGHLGTVDMGGTASDINIGGNLGRIFTAKGIKGITVKGDAGIIDGGTSVQGVRVAGDVDVLKATKTVSNAVVTGNTAVLSSGGSMSNVFIGGSSISVGAVSMSNVQIVGSVGASIEFYGSPWSISSIGLGNAFSVDQIAKALGIEVDALYGTGDTGPIPFVVGEPGGDNSDDAEYNTVGVQNLFYGGLNAKTTKNVVVGGAISDLVIHGSGSGSDSLFNSTIDDAYVKVGSKVFTKLNGIIGQVINSPQTIIRFINA